MSMAVDMNSTLSVDCVIFGFDGESIKVLLVRRRVDHPGLDREDLKLPGAMILENETLPQAAARVLEESTGLKGIELKQTSIFSNPHRVCDRELEWICKYHGIKTERVVSVGYYALVKLDPGIVFYTRKRGATWMNVDEVRNLIMDHMEILSDALTVLQREILYSAAGFSLLPKKFTVRQIQNLYEAIFGVEIDNRNFRKKLFSSDLLIDTGEMEIHVKHKPAKLYMLNKSSLSKRRISGFEFIPFLNKDKQ